MSMPETMAEYLVKLSADVDTNSFNSAATALEGIISKLKGIKELAAAGALVAGFAMVGKAATDAIRDVASADMEFRRLANSMWITKDSAKALSTAMKVMGVSEEDIAWIPELREQFFRLRSEMNQLATPRDADQQLKWIRSISYDIQSLQVRLKMLKEWVVYFLIKYLHPIIKEFQGFVRWLNDKLGKNMPQIAKRIAEFLGRIISLGYTAIKIIKGIISTVYNFVEGLPSNVKKWGAIFATVGAFIMAGPFGKFIMAMGGALLLLEDFIYYMNGWNSSKALAPMWEKLLNFLEGDTLASISDGAKELLQTIADGLDFIVKHFLEGIDWEGIKKSWSDGIEELTKGVNELFKSIAALFGDIEDSTDDKAKNRQRSFWTSIGRFVSDALKEMGKLAGLMGKIIGALALLFRGDFAGAARLLGVVITEMLEKTPTGRLLKHVSGADEKVNSATAMQYLQSRGLSKAGAAGAVGNFSAESNVDPSNVQLEYQWQKDDYLNRLLSGKMSREEFASDEIGFGLAQWTTYERKAALWDYAKEQEKPINDLMLQLDFFLKELREDFPDVYEALQRGDITVSEASNMLLHGYENPADQSIYVENDRADRSQSVYDSNFAGTGRSSFGLNPGSWGLSHQGFASTPQPYSTSSTTSSVRIGDINVNVTNSNASAQDIGRSMDDVLTARFGRGAIV